MGLDLTVYDNRTVAAETIDPNLAQLVLPRLIGDQGSDQGKPRRSWRGQHPNP
ncbi:hypothetical protein MB901379_02788 [Mycobacterium basiliense]|uniref:Uncharacterized protein n=1 Tax=Mycobacterium basiliense TaxID=2094119 RepID=A0A447GFP6_9MYCO|nr:hypothetical protein MB901379_02788 [Mycobacterium basiliense]